MPNPKVYFAFLIAFLFLVPLFGPASLVADKEVGGTLDRLDQGTTRLEIFADDLGEAMNVTLPAKAKVKEAHLTMTGLLPTVISQYDVGTDPLSIVGADVDDDGDIDLGVANSKSDSVSILINDGEGSFKKTKPLDFSVDGGPQDLVLMDLNGDGLVDLATANYDDESVTVRISSTEMFGSTATYKIGGSPLFLFGEDLDGDGHIDLAVVRKEFPVIALLFNKGDGTFNPSIDIKVGASPEGATIGDFDGDKDVDIAVASTDKPYSIIIVENKGGKKFVEGEAIEVQWPPSDVIATDFAGDGDLDLAVSSAQPGSKISILENTGSGFEAPVTLDYERQWAIFSADLDFDGFMDLVSVTRVDSTVRTFLNCHKEEACDGAFDLDQTFIIGSNPNDIFLADLDGDGDMDIATADLAGNSVSVAKNNGRGRYTWYDMYYITDSDKLIAKGDIDGDGDMDILSTNYNQMSVSVVWNEGRGEFTRVDIRDGYRVYPKEGGAGASEPFWITTADYDGDGDIDVEYGEELTFAIIMMFNEGDGKWDEQSVARIDKTNLLPAPPFVTFPMDVNGDGSLDIVTNHVNHDFISILINDGTGHFKKIINHSLEGTHPFDMVAHDFDGDGDKDLITANFGKALDFETTLTFIRNVGDGTFENVKNLTVKLGPRSLDVADFNNDGLDDIVVGFAARKGLSDIVPGEVAVILADEGGLSFKDPVYYRAGILPGRVYPADLNEDGFPDIICINIGSGSGGSISVLINKGDGTLRSQIEYPFVPFSDGEFHDLLGDGREELILPVLSTHLAVYRALYYPGDVSLNISGEEVASFPGILKSSEEINLTDSLNAYLKEKREEGQESGNITIPFGVVAKKAGIVGLTNVVIEYVIDDVEDVTPGIGPLDFNDLGTKILFIMLIVLIVLSIIIAAPNAPEEVEMKARRKKAAGRRKGKKDGRARPKRKVVTKKKPKKLVKKKEPKVKVEVIKKKTGKRHRDEGRLKKLERAVHLKDELIKKK